MNLITDVGFGDVKFLSDGVPQKFPTIIIPEPINAGGIDFGENMAQVYEHGGLRYITGNDAIEAIKAGAEGGNIQRNTTWLVGRMPILTRHAAYLAGVEDLKDASLTIGLPLGDFRALEGRVKEILQPLFADVTVLSQGVGILADHVSRHEHPGSGTILDIGFGTAIVLTYRDGKPTKAGTQQYTSKGLSEAAKRLKKRILSLTGTDIPLPEANAYIAQGGNIFRGNGKEIDLAPLIHEALASYTEELVNLLMSNHDTSLNRENTIILAGGGAYHVERYLNESYDGQIIVPPSPEYANVRGYGYLVNGR
ncbi:ParM/StbA family protein [Geobacter sp. FeAm09]|uniref:ParM/StbA family protein n=1 Tax=Geobacter sp. FeAm09 TaxID=2597769 RepID=UPI0011EEB030|nr:ParM/StbA family protein [Geobacter sp. FeAm09]QEM66719.1 ParM/StbA family protein [Geobacter sp. FeAm09]